MCRQVAIKTIKKAKIETEQDLVRIRREIQIMSSVTHPHIIHIFEGERPPVNRLGLGWGLAQELGAGDDR